MNRSTFLSPRSLASIALAGTLAGALGACVAGPAGTSGAGGPPLSPMYDVPPNLLRPDGTMINGLEPIDPSAVS